MICRLTGRLASISPDAAVIDLGSISYEVFVPAWTVGELQGIVGSEVTLFTLHYFEGNPAGAHLLPRLIGFLSESDREFFKSLTKVKGVSSRRALRVMSLPAHQLAAAIEQGNLRLLTTLPEVGKKTAAQMVTELRGQMHRFLEPSATPVAPAEMTDAQRIAVDILVQWGDRRADALRWVSGVLAADPTLTEPEAIVRAAYRVKQQT